jgi:hypothetical protein
MVLRLQVEGKARSYNANAPNSKDHWTLYTNLGLDEEEVEKQIKQNAPASGRKARVWICSWRSPASHRLGPLPVGGRR